MAVAAPPQAARRAPASHENHVLLMFQPPVGGVPEYVATLAEGLVKRGWTVSAAAPPDATVSDRLARSVNTLLPLRTRRGISLGADIDGTRRIARFCRQRRVDLIHAHSSKAGALATVVGTLSSTPSVYTPHAWSFQRELSPISARAWTLAERTLARSHALVIAVAEVERTEAISRRVVDPARIRLVETGIDDRILPERGIARTRLGTGADEFLVGWIGRLGPQKRSEHLPPLARALSGRGRLVAIGYGLADSGAGQEVKRAGSVVTAGVDPDLIYAACDALVVTSRWEASPLVVMEAMRAGLPVVAYAVGGIVDQIVDGVTGLLIEPGDVAALGAALCRLADEPELAARMGARARERFLARFSSTRMVDGVERDYRALLGAERGGARSRKVARR